MANRNTLPFLIEDLNTEGKYYVFRNLGLQMSPVCRVKTLWQTWNGKVSEMGFPEAGMPWVCSG